MYFFIFKSADTIAYSGGFTIADNDIDCDDFKFKI